MAYDHFVNLAAPWNKYRRIARRFGKKMKLTLLPCKCLVFVHVVYWLRKNQHELFDLRSPFHVFLFWPFHNENKFKKN